MRDRKFNFCRKTSTHCILVFARKEKRRNFEIRPHTSPASWKTLERSLNFLRYSYIVHDTTIAGSADITSSREEGGERESRPGCTVGFVRRQPANKLGPTETVQRRRRGRKKKERSSQARASPRSNISPGRDGAHIILLIWKPRL